MLKIFSKKEEHFVAFSTGIIDEINRYPEEAIQQKLLGDGFMITPEDGVVVSPCAGEVSMIFPTLHAVGIKTKSNMNVLIHIGVDTVKLNGEGFNSHVKVNQKISVGDSLITFDLDFIKNHPEVKSESIALIFTDNNVSCKVEKPNTHVNKNQSNIIKVKKEG